MRRVKIRVWAGVWLAGLLAVVLWGSACSKSEETGTTLVEVGKTPITREKVDQAFLGLAEGEQKQYLDRPGRRQLLDNLVTVELLYQEALRQKLDQDSRVSAKLEAMKQQALVEELINRSIVPADLYGSFQEHFLKIRSLVIELPENPSPAVEARAKAEADNLYAALKQKTAWEKLVEKKLPSPLILQEQDWGYMDREMLAEQVGFEAQEAVFALKQPKEFTRPLRTSQGFDITQVQETSGNLNPEGLTRDLAEYLLARKKEEVYRGYVTDLRTRFQKDIKPNSKNIEEFLSLGDRVSARQKPAEAAGTTVEPGSTGAPMKPAETLNPQAPAAAPGLTSPSEGAPASETKPSPVPAP